MSKKISVEYAKNFQNYDEKFSQMMATTAINETLLQDYLLPVNLFLMEDLKKYSSNRREIENKD